jgi:hypothetical protein
LLFQVRLKFVFFVCRGEQNPDPHHPLRHHTPHDSGGFWVGLVRCRTGVLVIADCVQSSVADPEADPYVFGLPDPDPLVSDADLFCNLFMTFYL